MAAGANDLYNAVIIAIKLSFKNLSLQKADIIFHLEEFTTLCFLNVLYFGYFLLLYCGHEMVRI